MSDTATLSPRERAVTGLETALQATGCQVKRADGLPSRCPAEGLIVLEVREAADITPVLSPLTWEIDLPVTVTVVVSEDDGHDRDAALEARLATIGAALVADPTLSGAVDYALPEAPSLTAVELAGAGAAAEFAVTLSYVSPTPLG